MIKNISNTRFGRLVALVSVPPPRQTKHTGAWWECKCDCGNKTIVRGTMLRQGNTQSCGCLQRDRVKVANSLQPGQAAKNRLLRRYKYYAKKRHLEWAISNKEFFFLTQRECFYCDRSPEQIVEERNGIYTYNGIDRIDNLLGYTIENTVSCCKICNMAKGKMSMSKFVDLCIQITRKHEGAVL